MAGSIRSEEWRTELDLYASGLRVCTQNAKVHYNLGKVLSRIGDVNAAEHNYWNAIRLNPNYEHAMNNLANILEGKRTNADCLFNLGNLYQKMRRPDDALEAWKNATVLDPRHSKALTNLFVALDEREECDAVVAMAEKIPHSVVEQSAALSFQIGVCLGKIARFSDAERRVLYQRWTRYDLAENSYLQALMIDSETSSVRWNLQAVQEKLNRTRTSARPNTHS
ncbi:tetratricopeptide repeat protein [Ostertagia ostertagi]